MTTVCTAPDDSRVRNRPVLAAEFAFLAWMAIVSAGCPACGYECAF
jgi:hypothetical protein